MSNRTARVVDLVAFRKRREEELEERTTRAAPVPVVYVVPMWMWYPVWTLP